MKKIVSVIHSLDVAGAENVCIDICKNIDSEKYCSYIVTVFNSIPLADKVKDSKNVEVITLGVSKDSKFWFLSIRPILKLRKVLKEINPDIVHSHLWGFGTYILIALSGLQVKKRIATIHTSGGHYTSSRIYKKLAKTIEKWMCRLYKFQLVCVSKSVKEIVSTELNISDVRIIENGVDTDLFKKKEKADGSKTDYPVIIHVGRFIPAKNHRDILKSLIYIKSEFPNFKMLFIGDGVEDNLKSFQEYHLVAENIEFCGVRKNVDELLREADIGIFPSSYEGLPLSLLEMMSSELPVVVSDIPILKELTRNGRSGKLVPLHMPQKLANSIVKLANDKKLMKHMGENGREIVIQHYSLRRMVGEYENLYG